MGKDEFKIIITKTGEIKVLFEGLPEQKLKSYIEIFEEAIGPVKQIEAGGALPPSSPLIVDTDEDKEKTKI